jgi:N-methylhydantoinase A
VGIRTMLIPPHPGVLCALGCAIADLRYDLSQTVEQRVSALEEGFIAGVLQAQRVVGERQVRESETAVSAIEVSHVAEMSYAGQIHSLRVPIEPGWSRERVTEAFHDAYRGEYGNLLGDIPAVIVSLKTAVSGVRAAPLRAAAGHARDAAAAPSAHRPVHFGGWHDTPVYDRRQLGPGSTLRGPAIIEQADTTTVIEPGMAAAVDARDNILVELR